jgi:hypothetical protein
MTVGFLVLFISRVIPRCIALGLGLIEVCRDEEYGPAHFGCLCEKLRPRNLRAWLMSPRAIISLKLPVVLWLSAQTTRRS